MFETFKPIVIALLFVFFGTKNGRNLMIQTIRNSFLYIPFSIRRLALSNSALVPLKISRLLLYMATSPIGNEKKWIQKIKQDTWEGVWIAPNLKSLKQAQDTAQNKDLIILYIHGGGFSMGYASMYMSTFQFIINQLQRVHQIRASILSLEYSLSPEHVWPKACNEAVEAYRYLIHDLGINPSKVILAGDSAGGNLVASTLLTLRDQRIIKELHNIPPLPSPSGAALLSPWIDITPNQPSFEMNEQYDTMSPNHIAQYTSNYIPNFNTLDDESKISMIRNPLVSPLYGDFNRICPLFLAYGENEILRTSIETFKSNLERDGCNLTTLVGENASHIWMVYSLMATTKQTYEKDCVLFINWIASTCKSQLL